MIRQPVASDKYYPRNVTDLEEQLAACLAQPAPTVHGPALQRGLQPGRRLCGLLVPHGSLSDSGFVAASAYSLLEAELGDGGSRRSGTLGSSCRSAAAAAATAAGAVEPLRLLLLGTNHFTSRPAACLSSATAWRTPLGDVQLDAMLPAALAAAGLPVNDAAHNREHSIENQLPFLQRCLAGRRPYAVAPVCVGWLDGAPAVDQVAQQLLPALLSAPALLVATSDFTHAGAAYGEPPCAPWMSLREHCLWRDSPLLHAICQGGAAGFLAACDATGTSLCGRWPVAIFLRVAEELAWSIELLSYAPSDLYVDTGSINGFAAFAAWG